MPFTSGCPENMGIWDEFVGWILWCVSVIEFCITLDDEFVTSRDDDFYCCSCQMTWSSYF